MNIITSLSIEQANYRSGGQEVGCWLHWTKHGRFGRRESKCHELGAGDIDTLPVKVREFIKKEKLEFEPNGFEFIRSVLEI